MPLPQQVINQLSREPAKTPGWSFGILFFALGILIVIVLIYFSMTAVYEPYLTSQLSSLQTQVSTLSQSISSSDQTNLIAFYSETENIQSLLQGHVIFSNFFTWLEANTEAKVYYSQLSFTTGTQITLTGLGATEADVNQQIAIFEASPDITNVTVSNVGVYAGTSFWQFTAKFLINPSMITSSQSAAVQASSTTP